MKNKVKIYFLSTGRVGTSFLYKYFNVVYPELRLSHQLQWSRIINIVGNVPLSFNFREKLIHFAFKILKKESVPASTLDPLLSLPIYISIKNNAINNTKIVHLVRDPRDFVTSFMNWKNQSLSKKILHYMVPFWQPFPFGKGIKFYRWIFMSKFEKFCWVWFYKNTLFKQLQNLMDYKLVRIEDLTKSTNNLHHMRELVRFLELKEKDYNYQNFASQPVNKSDIKEFPSYVNWSQKQKDTLQRICGDLMHEFGYQ